LRQARYEGNATLFVGRGFGDDIHRRKIRAASTAEVPMLRLPQPRRKQIGRRRTTQKGTQEKETREKIIGIAVR
jgi:hypothetical protein